MAYWYWRYLMDFKVCKRKIKKIKDEIDFLTYKVNTFRKRHNEWFKLHDYDECDLYFDYVESCLDYYEQELRWKYDDLHDLIRELMFFYEPGHIECCKYWYERIW